MMNPNDYRPYIAAIVHRLLPRWTQRYFDAEDVVQECMLRLLRWGVEPTGNACLSRVANVEVIDAVRRIRGQKTRCRENCIQEPLRHCHEPACWDDHSLMEDVEEAEALLGAELWQRLLTQNYATKWGRFSAIRDAKQKAKTAGLYRGEGRSNGKLKRWVFPRARRG